MKRFAFWASVLVTALAAAQVQPLEVQPLQLKPVDRIKVETGVLVGYFTAPIKSDLDGNIFLRALDTSSPGSGPILRIGPDGGKAVQFLVPSGAELTDYAPGTGGELYIMALGPKVPEYKLTQYFSDGTVKSTTTIESPFRPLQFAVFRSGELLVSGIEEPPQGQSGKSAGKPRIALFSAGGSWIKDIAVENDTKLPTPGGNSKDPIADFDAEIAVSMTDAQTGDDGNIYLNRHTPTGPIFVVTSAGAIARRIPLHPPKQCQLGSVRVIHGRIVVEYLQYAQRDQPEILKITKYIYQILDRDTGELLEQYWQYDDALGGAFAAYHSGAFIYVGGPNGTITLAVAKP